MSSVNSRLAVVLLGVLAAGRAWAQSPRVLYTWNGTGNAQGWAKNFGANDLTFENSTEGELTITETGAAAGSDAAIRDDFNGVAEGGPSIGGLDLFGLDALEFDLGHNGPGPVSVQFYVQATPDFNFVGLGPDQVVTPGGVNTYVAPLDGLSPAQSAYIRVVGINIRPHTADGNLVWTLKELRSVGQPAAVRDIANHEPGSSDNGLQGAIVNFDRTAVEGNVVIGADNGQNQTGLSQNLAEPPAGNTGSLRWVDLAGRQGAAVTWTNGTVFNGNTFNERPADLSSYQKILVRMAATNVTPDAVISVGVQYFLQTGNFAFHTAGANLSLPADGQFHELEFPISTIPNLAFVVAHGLNLQDHPAGDLLIDVDLIRAVGAQDFPDCNGNRTPDEQDLANRTSLDCNSNLIPDECDIAAGTSRDCNTNRVPDECDIQADSQARLLYTWEGTGDIRGWIKHDGIDKDVTFENLVEGELTIIENGPPGTFWILSDGFNALAEDTTDIGGLDLSGKSSLEFEVGHNGDSAVNVQFFVQATPGFQYVALGPDQPIEPGAVATYSAPLDILTPAQITYLRTVGMNIREHLAEGNLTWTIREVRAIGRPLSRRDLATHEPGSSDGGLNGATAADGMSFVAIQGNDGGANQTGLSLNTGPTPPGNTGSLRWVDLFGLGGASVAWYNGTAWGTNSFNERPVDLSPYGEVLVRMAATNETPGSVESVDVRYFLQTDGFTFYQAGAAQSLPADGQFHELTFSIRDIPDRLYVDAHGIDLGEHDSGSLIIDVDSIRALADEATARDCNANRVPDECDIAGGEAKDCNLNQVPDSCDIAGGLEADANQNGIPDSCEEVLFKRGDTDGDGKVNITDPINLFSFLFTGGGSIPCPDSADADDDRDALNITDGIYILSRLFLGGDPFPLPGQDTCGPDPTTDQLGPCGYAPASCLP